MRIISVRRSLRCLASMRVAFEELSRVLVAALRETGMAEERASRCGSLFAEASRDGVASHGVDRFPRFMRMIARGVVDVHARPARSGGAGSLERWDGRRGPGNLNAYASMARAIALGREHGIGCVALANTNHWMRGGTYGWQAAGAGVIGICWTNTLANLPPWGAASPRVGNNPLVLAVPRASGDLVLDMALSQFSVGALTAHARRGEALPVAGGYDPQGHPTQDPSAILESGRLLPIGFWKGSGLAVMLDLIAAAVSGGHATHEIPLDPDEETALSQVFIAIDPALLSSRDEIDRLADALVAHLHASDGAVRYPGERTLETRLINLRDGVPVDEAIWRQITSRDWERAG
jgi:3-dehydro-L-gulonate 2-dehydrogenase